MTNVRVLIGDLFESDAQTLTNTVNTVGVMGKGIALQFKKRFPDMYDEYVRLCERDAVRIGEPYLYRALIEPWVLNFPTKEHWRSPSRLEAIQRGLSHLESHYESWGITSLAVPPLGCGEGGLEWRIVGPTLYRGLGQLSIPVELYAPFGTPHSELESGFLESLSDGPTASQTRVPAAGVALAVILERIAARAYHYPIGRISMQKIAYFATHAGIPTDLEFERRPFGPFAEGMKRLLSQLINNGLIEEQQQGRMFINRPGPTLADAKRAFAADLDRWEPDIDRVVDLFLRLSSTRRAELAASVHYTASLAAGHPRHSAASEPDLISAVSRWKSGRKPQPTADEITSAAHTLAYLGWIDVESPDEDDLVPV